MNSREELWVFRDLCRPKEGQRILAVQGALCLPHFSHTCHTQMMSGTLEHSVISNSMKPNQLGVLEPDLIPLQLLDPEKI